MSQNNNVYIPHLYKTSHIKCVKIPYQFRGDRLLPATKGHPQGSVAIAVCSGDGADVRSQNLAQLVRNCLQLVANGQQQQTLLLGSSAQHEN